MRDIKFRYWDIINEVMIEDAHLMDSFNEKLARPKEYCVEQYSGKMWEGDKITFLPIYGSTKIRQSGVVCYCEKREAFCVKSETWNYPLYFCKDIEVTGTIHDKEAK